MIIRNSVAFLFVLGLAGCDRPANTPTPTLASPAPAVGPAASIDLQVVRTFFQDLGDATQSISRDSLSSDESHRQVFQWVLNAIQSSEKLDEDIKELRFSRAMVSSESAYELKIHQARGLVELLPNRAYIQFHAVHETSDPEYHGVIDGDGPTLLSFWGDGA